MIWENNGDQQECLPDCAHAAVCGENDDRRNGRFQSLLEVRETLHVQHVDFVDKEDARHKLGDTLIDVFVHNFVDFSPQLV